MIKTKPSLLNGRPGLGFQILMLWTLAFHIIPVAGWVNGRHYHNAKNPSRVYERSMALSMESQQQVAGIQSRIKNETTVDLWLSSSSSSSFLSATSIPTLPQQQQIPQNVQTTIYRWADQYMDYLHEKPLLTKAITATLVQVSGDFMSQHLVAALHQEPLIYDPSRTLCFALIGFFYKAPMLHSMYRGWDWTGKYLQSTFSLTRDQRIALELLLDQTIGVLIFYPTYFAAYEIIAAGVHGHAIDWSSITVDRMTAVALPHCAVWPLAQYLSFRYVPEPLRVLFSNIVAVFYNIVLCNIIAG